MAERLKIDSGVHELKLGKSFEPKSKVAFHSIRYDFKPESLDSTKSSTVAVGESNSVTVSVPHIQSSGTSHTVFKGNKRPVQKECVLVIDHGTGEFTLEKLSNAIQLKKTRVEGSSKATRPITPIELKKGSVKQHKKKHDKADKREPSETSDIASKKEPGDSSFNTSSQSRKDLSENTNVRKEPDRVSPVQMMDDSSDSSGSDMDISPPPVRTERFANLSADLALSESGSDSD